jgi:hypothetical protein
MARDIRVAVVAVLWIAVLAAPSAAMTAQPATQPSTQPTTAHSSPDVRQLAQLARTIGAARGFLAVKGMFWGLMADNVALTHFPPAGPDSPTANAGDLILRSKRVQEAAFRALKGFRVDVTSVATHGDEVIFETMWRGTTAQGKQIAYRRRYTWGVKNGAVVSEVVEAMDGEAAAREWSGALQTVRP